MAKDDRKKDFSSSESEQSFEKFSRDGSWTIGKLFRGAFCHIMATGFAAAGSEVDDPVGAFGAQVLLHDQDCIPFLDQLMHMNL